MGIWEELLVERERVFVEMEIDEEWVAELTPDARLELIPDIIGPGIIARLQDFVLTEKLESRVQVVRWKTPASWWQHLKRDWIDHGGWRAFLLRFAKPVRYHAHAEEVRFDSKAVYPRGSSRLGEWVRH